MPRRYAINPEATVLTAMLNQVATVFWTSEVTQACTDAGFTATHCLLNISKASPLAVEHQVAHAIEQARNPREVFAVQSACRM